MSDRGAKLRLTRVTFAAVAAVLAVGVIAPIAAGAATPAVTPTPVTTPTGQAIGAVRSVRIGATHDVAVNCSVEAADGTEWVLVLTPPASFRLVRVGLDGSVTGYAVHATGTALASANRCLAVDGSGALWITGLTDSTVGRFDVSNHTLTTYATPTAHSGPAEITTAPDGSLWFDERTIHAVAHLDPRSGHIVESRLPGGTSDGPFSIAAAHDGSVWVAAHGPAVQAHGITMVESLFHFSAQGVLTRSLPAAYSVIGALSLGLSATSVVISSDGRVCTSATASIPGAPAG